MALGVFVHRADSIYDDLPYERYQFPSQYLGRVNACIGDWIIYYEPTKVAGSRGYFAVAKVRQVVPDPNEPGMYLAVMEPENYIPFLNPVAFTGPDGWVERGLLNDAGRLSGRAQSAVRPISAADFNRIVQLGLGDDTDALPRVGNPLPGLSENQTPFLFETDQERLRSLTSRPVRDRIFRGIVLRAYDACCAITGLKLINGGGRAEVEAAHIKPVEAKGPDVIGNGIALSGTVHWMFDRGLISIADDHQILISRHVNDVQRVRAMINHNGRILPPNRAADHPHPRFLQWHRENCFKA